MSADFKISELSANKMELERLSGNRKTVLNFVTPTNWRVGDTVAMQINRDPFYLRLVNGQFVMELPPEPPNGWGREFYTLYNMRTKDRISADFEWVEGFDKLAAEAKQNTPPR